MKLVQVWKWLFIYTNMTVFISAPGKNLPGEQGGNVT